MQLILVYIKEIINKHLYLFKSWKGTAFKKKNHILIKKTKTKTLLVLADVYPDVFPCYYALLIEVISCSGQFNGNNCSMHTECYQDSPNCQPIWIIPEVFYCHNINQWTIHTVLSSTLILSPKR